jgi:hypothetical protein
MTHRHLLSFRSLVICCHWIGEYSIICTLKLMMVAIETGMSHIVCVGVITRMIAQCNGNQTPETLFLRRTRSVSFLDIDLRSLYKVFMLQT